MHPISITKLGNQFGFLSYTYFRTYFELLIRLENRFCGLLLFLCFGPIQSYVSYKFVSYYGEVSNNILFYIIFFTHYTGCPFYCNCFFGTVFTFKLNFSNFFFIINILRYFSKPIWLSFLYRKILQTYFLSFYFEYSLPNIILILNSYAAPVIILTIYFILDAGLLILPN